MRRAPPYNSAYPWMKQWGDTMATSYNQQLGGYNAYNTAMVGPGSRRPTKAGDPMVGMLGGLAGTVAGSFGGPMVGSRWRGAAVDR